MATSYPPYAVWTDNDHSGAVIIVTTICLLYWLVPGLIQQGVSYSRSARVSYSEGVFLVSMVVGILQSSLILSACHYGLGKSGKILGNEHVRLAELLYYVSNLFLVLVLGLVKCSVSLFIATLTVNKLGSIWHAPRPQKITLATVLLLNLIWTVASVIALAFPCNNSEVMCIGTMTRWRGIFAGDAVTDLIIAASAANVVWRTHAAKRMKITWYFPFMLRICVPVCAGLRLITTNDEKLNADPTLAPWLLIIVSQLQVLLSIIGYTTPALKKTMLDLVTNYGTVGESQTGSRSRSGGVGYALKDLRYSKKKHKEGNSWPGSNVSKRIAGFAGSGSENTAVVERGDHDSDGDSQKGIIRRDEVEVSYSSAAAERQARPEWVREQ